HMVTIPQVGKARFYPDAYLKDLFLNLSTSPAREAFNYLKIQEMLKFDQAFSSFSVTDLQQAQQFYSEVLGMAVTQGQYTLNLHIGSDKKVIVYPKLNHLPATFTVLNFPVDDIEKEIEILKGKGIEFEIYNEPELKTDEKGILRSGGPLMAWFKDPFGNILSIIQENPGK
ncbi:MAG TPA: VOC family protein, partial [Flavobacterium sp.]